MPKKQPVIDTEVNPLFGEETDFVAVSATEMFSEEELEVPEVQPEPGKKPEDKPKEYSQEEKDNMLAIVDAIMFEGEYSEVFSFGLHIS